MHDDADRGTQAGERREFVARAHAAREHEQVAAELLAVGGDEHVESPGAVVVGAVGDGLCAAVGDDGDARAPKGGAQHLAATAIEVARHRVGAVVHDAHLGAGVRGGECQLETEHAGPEDDDASPGTNGLEHAFGVGEVAKGGDALRKGVVVCDEGRRVLLERGEVSAVPLDAVERGHVRPRSRREHERGRRPRSRRCRGGPLVRRGRSMSRRPRAAHVRPASSAVVAVADRHGLQRRVADCVLRDEHPVVAPRQPRRRRR